MRYFHIKNTITGLLILTTLINAQSFFSMKSFGEELLSNNATALGLGGLVSLHRENPSFPLVLNKTSFYASVLSNLVYGKYRENGRLIYDVRPMLVEGKISLPYHFRIGVRLSEIFNQNFDVYSETTSFAGYHYQRHVIGKGGMYRIGINCSKSFLNNKFSCGFEYAKILGQSLEQWTFEVLDRNYITLDTVITGYSTHNLKFGVFTDVSFLTIGAIFENFLTGVINSKVISHNTIVDSISGLKFNLPQGFGAGIIFNKLTNTKFYLDIFYRNWTKTLIADTVVTKYQNSIKYSLALEHWFMESYPLRIGMRYYLSYLRDYQNIPIKEYALTTGSRIPIANFGAFDYSLELIRRFGKETKETIARINFSLAFEESWKKRTRRWGY